MAQLTNFVETASEVFPLVADIQRDWEALLRALGREDAIVVLDEFPYLIQSDDALPSKIQRVWDLQLEETGMTLVYGLYFATNVLLYSIVVYYPQLLAEFGVSSSFVISLYLSALGIAGGLSAYFYDRIKRRFDYRQLTAAALLLWFVGFSFAAAATSPILEILPVVLFGLGQGLVFPTVLLWVEELIPADRQGQFSSYVAIAGYVGQFLSPILFGVIADPFGVRTVFVTAAAFAGVVLVVAGIRYAMQ